MTRSRASECTRDKIADRDVRARARARDNEQIRAFQRRVLRFRSISRGESFVEKLFSTEDRCQNETICAK